MKEVSTEKNPNFNMHFYFQSKFQEGSIKSANEGNKVYTSSFCQRWGAF